MTQPDVSIILPCLDERAGVAGCIRNAFRALDTLGCSGEVVLVDNGSTDGSPQVAAALGARIVREPARGYGNACRAGLAGARGRTLVLGDADGSYDFVDLGKLLRALGAGADLVIGSRLKGDIRPGAMPWLHRYVGTPAIAALLALTFRLSVSDPNSGLRAISREGYERLDLVTSGMEFASEMLVKARMAGLVIAEVPIVYLPRRGTSKLRPFRDGWKHVAFVRLHARAVPPSTAVARSARSSAHP